jgi:hypothetical protein
MSKDAGATGRVLLSFGVIAGVLGLSIVVAKIIQANVAPQPSHDAEPDALPAQVDDAGVPEVPPLESTAADAQVAESPCEKIAKEVEANATRLAAKVVGDASSNLPAQMPDLFREAHCVKTKNGGIWAMIPTDVRPHKAPKKEPKDGGKAKDGETDSFETVWEVVHVAADGERVSLPQPPFLSGTMQSLDLEEPSVFDFNGDGEDEVILTGSRWEHEGPSVPYGRIWTFKAKKDGMSPASPERGRSQIEPYTAAPEFASTSDIDDDDRPDLLTNGLYMAIGEAACSGFGKEIAGPLLAAHSHSDGSFAMNDEAAIAFAKKRCPSRPKFIVDTESDGGAVEATDGGAESSAVDRLVCARLWGASEGDISAMVTKECKKLSTASGDAGACAPEYRGDPVCEAWPKLKPWLKAKPPLLLK